MVREVGSRRSPAAHTQAQPNQGQGSDLAPPVPQSTDAADPSTASGSSQRRRRGRTTLPPDLRPQRVAAPSLSQQLRSTEPSNIDHAMAHPRVGGMVAPVLRTAAVGAQIAAFYRAGFISTTANDQIATILGVDLFGVAAVVGAHTAQGLHHRARAMVGGLKRSDGENGQAAVEEMLHSFAQANGESEHWPQFVTALDAALVNKNFCESLANTAAHPDYPTRMANAYKIVSHRHVGPAMRLVLHEGIEKYREMLHKLDAELVRRSELVTQTRETARRNPFSSLGKLERILERTNTKLRQVSPALSANQRTKLESLKEQINNKIQHHLKMRVLDGHAPINDGQRHDLGRALINWSDHLEIKACAEMFSSGTATIDDSEAGIRNGVDMMLLTHSENVARGI
jgi:hypothetical protein